MSNKIILIFFLFIAFSCISRKNVKTTPIKLVAFIKKQGLDSISKSDFELEKFIHLNSSKFKIKYVTAYLYEGEFRSVHQLSFAGNSLNPITHIYTFINAKPPFKITFGDIKCAYEKAKTKRLIYANEFTLKIY